MKILLIIRVVTCNDGIETLYLLLSCSELLA
jgi:hypothetical protein